MSRRTVFLCTLLIIISTCSLFIDKILPAPPIEQHTKHVNVAAVNQDMINNRIDSRAP